MAKKPKPTKYSQTINGQLAAARLQLRVLTVQDRPDTAAIARMTNLVAKLERKEAVTR